MIILHKFVLFLHILAIAGSVDQNFSLHFSVIVNNIVNNIELEFTFHKIVIEVCPNIVTDT